MCDTVCPWNRVSNFSMRKIVREATFGLTEIESEDIWRCTTCGKCPQVCPRDVKQIESGVALRRIATEYDVFPHAGAADPPGERQPPRRGQPVRRRPRQARQLGRGPGRQALQRGHGIPVLPRLLPLLRPARQEDRQGHGRDPQQGGVDFGILGTEESCCGESIRKTGDEALFKTLARQNIRPSSSAG